MNKRVAAIVGPTASGKSALALRLAQQLSGEIIAADSRTVYQGMDIATAKPSPAAQKLVPHHLLNVVQPDERFTVADFQRLAQRAIQDIQGRNKLPILVGGTGLYIDAVIYDLPLRTASSAADREQLQALSLSELQARVDALGVELNPSDYHNPRRLVRAIETGGVSQSKRVLPKDTIIIGIDPGSDTLNTAIKRRVDQMFAAGLVEEARALVATYSWDHESMTGIGYRELRDLIEGDKTETEARQEIITHTRQLAKRQLTWFRRNPDIRWVTNEAEAIQAFRL